MSKRGGIVVIVLLVGILLGFFSGKTYFNNSSASAAQDALSAFTYHNDGWHSFSHGDYSSAYTYFSQHEKNNPHSVSILLGLGWSLFKQGKYNESVQYFNSAYTINPEIYSSVLGKGMIYFMDSNYIQSLQFANNALTLGTDEVFTQVAFELQGFSHLHREEYDSAMLSFSNAIAVDQSSLISHLGMLLSASRGGYNTERELYYLDAKELISSGNFDNSFESIQFIECVDGLGDGISSYLECGEEIYD